MFLLLLLLISFSFYFVFLTWCLRLHARVLRRPFCVDSGNSMCFSYWKNVRLKPFCLPHSLWHRRFQLLLKECTIEAWRLCVKNQPRFVSVVIERMYDWSPTEAAQMTPKEGFSCYWKNVRLKPQPERPQVVFLNVSVVIERMYDWSSETNWLKINDFWQLVSGLFFENGRSAQKVPLFSKIWGDCLTVFDSCGNI